MTRDGASVRRKNVALTALLLTVAALAVAPTGISFSGGIGTGDPGFDATHGGCTSCHGGGAFASSSGDVVTVTFTGADGFELAGPYNHGEVYTITITLDEQVTGGSNVAGFNLFVDAGSFAAGTASRITGSGEATHVDGSASEWTVLWTAPDEGAATFRLFVNDVDGDGVNSPGDEVHLRVFSLLDDQYAMPGAVVEHEPHVGVPLPQYWLGLIALATMIVVILFAYVYLKYSNPHNANHKDR